MTLRVAVTDPVGVVLHRMGVAPTSATMELAKLVARQRDEVDLRMEPRRDNSIPKND
jgi:hypothetical protein